MLVSGVVPLSHTQWRNTCVDATGLESLAPCQSYPFRMAYDFRSLSPLDFEELTQDLLQRHWGVTLESFATGRDRGIDLRHLAPAGGNTIVQVKHYVASGYATLRSHLRRKELPKIEALSPDRYVLVTSVGLSPDRKQELAADLSPFVQSAADVFGQDDVNALLRAHPDIEQRHYKLWLTSTAVLDAVVNAEVIGRSDALLLDIQRKAEIYVRNDSFPQAQRILEANHVCLISGPPGIGKTTLAEMLLAD